MILADPEVRFVRFPAAQDIAADSQLGGERIHNFRVKPLALPWHPNVHRTEKELP
jgi:hypothetical protein